MEEGTSLGMEHELGVVDTIYEDREEGVHERITNFDVCCNLAFARDSAWLLLQTNPHSSPTQQVLQRSVWSWCEATGFPASVTVNVRGRTFKLHKFPLVSKSGFFKRQLMEGNEVELPDSFPGGAAIFEVVAAYCYGATIVMDSSNIAALRCASEFFEMTEEYCRDNLSKRSELYFNEAVLSSWEDSIEVLRTCKNLHRLAEEMLIVNSCIEAISVMAVMNRFEKKYELKEGNSVDSCEDWWINDLLTLPFDYFGQFIACVRRRGMQENLIGRTMLLYVDRWIFDMLRASEGSVKTVDTQALSGAERRAVIELIVRLLPAEKDAMPVSFLFAILRCALAWNASLECRLQLEKRIAAQLEQATVTDFLLPLKTEEEQILASRTEIESMQKIVSQFISMQTNVGFEYSSDYHFSHGRMNSCESFSCVNPHVSAVAKVWDEYLAEIAFDQSLSPPVFLNLIDTVPSSTRVSHDRLYKAIHIYFKTHAQISEQQKQNICKTLNCQKLSREACVHAVQNDLLPLRMIVQAMFMHQLQATSSSNENNNSSITGVNKDIKYDGVRKNGKSISSLGNILKRDEAFIQANHLKADFDETSTRLRNLEDEIVRMKISFQASLRKSKLESDAPKEVMDIQHIISEESFPTDLYPKQRPEFTSKSCGSAVTHKLVRSLQKLNLKKAIRTANCVHDDEELFHSEASNARKKTMKERSRRQTRNVSECGRLEISLDKLRSGDSKEKNASVSKAVRRRHRRNLSAS